ncbi:transcriptional regulator, IclR family [Rhodococcus rhodochrous J3]|uniref:Transcriptional regulator, IclR family n=1 Tax=Rhodococcus rhodochrous J3 TaxID=903528 RepID=A0ABY1MGX5_RHORH|nr:IclR family transcriptional regulator [Rhodococcus rhodochrous]MBF4477344.1 IclR family transcriptional regulator [Rhodococcus rhodochrous]MCB8912500.1 IclR family transcriptional regulator [Rhodococcus rhodochrous]TWH52473.1 IclR family transcriptional regulator [Rhodococcus rhodochrous J38]SMG55854.1 transcriptional regulator, IclR family [Rhodococcus rhodochrous J3]
MTHSAAVTTDENRRSVLGRAFDILECFTDAEPEQTIGSLCAATGLPPATVHRMLASLVEWGAVERAARGKYRLGMRLWRLGWGVPGARTLKDVARPHLVDLHTSTREAVALASRDGDSVVLADVIAGSSTRTGRILPRRLDLVNSAPGSVFMAYMSPDEVSELTAHTQHDHNDAFRLRQELCEIRRTGAAVVQSADGMYWIASPVFAKPREVRSVVCIAVHRPRFNIGALVHAVVDTARAVSDGLPPSLRSVG